jgi:EAL domain-containing protein (putative c-di-GMP-specific phosphodiesterase class I)
VLAEAANLPPAVSLSINVHASTLGKDREFADFLCAEAEANSFDTKRLIVEIVEYAPFWDGPKFLASLEELRNREIRIALDDVGVGQSNYRMLIDCHPDYFKIDRYIIQGSHTDPYRQAVLESILLLAHRFNARAIAEGVEQAEELDGLLASGIDLVQGYLLSLPLEISQVAKMLFSGNESEKVLASVQEGVV